MFTKIHSNYNNVSANEMRNAVFNHLYKMNIHQLYREGKVITDVWKAICAETAKDDLNKIIIDGNLRTYWQRLKEGAV